MLTIALLTLVVTAHPAGTDGEFREVTVYDGHVTLEVPANWNEIPQEVLEFYSLRAAEASGGRMAEIYQYGFRPGDPEIDFALPQVLIQIRESGRLSYRQFLVLPSAESMRATGERTLANRVGPLVRGLELGDTVFDKDSFALHLSNTLDLSFEGETAVKSVAFLTERGLFTVHFYTRASRAEAMDPVFTHIVDSVHFDDELEYRPRLSDGWPPRPSTILFAGAVLIAAAAGAIHIVQRRRRQS